MPLKDRLQAVRWACGFVFCITVLCFLLAAGALFRSTEAFQAIAVAGVAAVLLLHLTFYLSVRLLLRWRDPTPEDRKRIRSWMLWGGTYGYILVIWTLTDGEATSPFFKDRND